MEKKEKIKLEDSKRINNEFDFWVDATTLIKTLVREDTEELIINHVKERGFTDNEQRLFREYLSKAFDMYPMMAYLKNH